jgi:hypothetical protein
MSDFKPIQVKTRKRKRTLTNRREATKEKIRKRIPINNCEQSCTNPSENEYSINASDQRIEAINNDTTYKNFEIVKITGDGNCFFRSISYFFYGTQNFHRDLRIEVVDNVIRNWVFFENFVVRTDKNENENDYGRVIENENDYSRLMKQDGVYAGEVEMSSLLQLYPEYKFEVHVKVNDSVVVHGSGDRTCHLLFSGPLDNGHYDVLIRSSHFHEINKHKRSRKATLTHRREMNEDKIREKCSQNKKCISTKSKVDFSISNLHQNENLNDISIPETEVIRDLISSPDVEPYLIGYLSQKCAFCGALFFEGERNSAGKFSLCCYNGKIKLPHFKILDEIKSLFTRNDEIGKNFRKNIRQYNNTFSFVSFGANIILPKTYGPYCFKIQGVLHHRISSLYAKSIEESSYGQLYILDFDVAQEIRMPHAAFCKH